jgi:hypothetical protein
MVAGLTLLLALMASQAAVPRCVPEAGRLADSVRGEVTKGNSVEAPTSGGWILRLRPVDGGWTLEIGQAGRNDEDLSRLTPPWHFVPNPRDIMGSHFRNAENSGPNDGSVNAPGEVREFIFSPEVGRGIEYNGSATTEADVAKVERFGRGWFRLEEFRLTAPRRGERASFEWLKFSACLSWPASAKRT